MLCKHKLVRKRINKSYSMFKICNILSDLPLVNFRRNIFSERQKQEKELFNRFEANNQSTAGIRCKFLMVYTKEYMRDWRYFRDIMEGENCLTFMFLWPMNWTVKTVMSYMLFNVKLYIFIFLLKVTMGSFSLPLNVFFLSFKNTIWFCGSICCCRRSCCVFGFRFLSHFLHFCRYVHTLNR